MNKKEKQLIQAKIECFRKCSCASCDARVEAYKDVLEMGLNKEDK